MAAKGSAKSSAKGWQDDLYGLLRAANVTQFSYVPDAGHHVLIDKSIADPDVHSIALTTEEEGVAIAAPRVPLVSNVKAEGVRDPAEIKALLVQQVTGRVRWRESVEWMARQGVTETVEIGAGKALSGMVRRIAREIEAKAVNGAGDLAALKG